MKYIVALDQGTTSSRAIVFDHEQRIVAVGQKEFQQFYPQPGWVEHDPMEIWATQYGVLHRLFIDHGGCYIDGVKTSAETLDSLPVGGDDYLTLRIGIKKDAKYIGGLNLFGEHFGNYSQHINMKIDYTQ